MPRVCGIFTTSPISPSPSLRQCSSRYAIHARRNLPDKEFRYLRTLIVRAAVYGCFGRQLLPEGITDFLNIPAPSRRQSLYVHFTCLQRPVFLINSRRCRFSAPAPHQLGLGGHCNECRSLKAIIGAGTGPLIPKLRGQFAEFLKDGSLERLRLRASPTCVSFSTDPLLATAAFLGSLLPHFGNKSASTPHQFRVLQVPPGGRTPEPEIGAGQPSRLIVGCSLRKRTTD